MEIRLINWEQDDLSMLLTASELEGYKQIRRMLTDWQSGTNRFDKPGECMFVAIKGDVVGVCGLNDNGDNRGRLRRLYVHPNYRNKGVGNKLTQACIDHGLQTFENIVTNAGGDMAMRFYNRLGWRQINEDRLTHSLL